MVMFDILWLNVELLLSYFDLGADLELQFSWVEWKLDQALLCVCLLCLMELTPRVHKSHLTSTHIRLTSFLIIVVPSRHRATQDI